MKLQQIPLLKDTVQRRIADLSDNTKDQANVEIKNSQFGLFSIQFNLMKLPTLPWYFWQVDGKIKTAPYSRLCQGIARTP